MDRKVNVLITRMMIQHSYSLQRYAGKGSRHTCLLVEDGIVSRDMRMKMASILARRSVGATMSPRADITMSQILLSDKTF